MPVFRSSTVFLALSVLFSLSACTPASYPEGKVEQSLVEIFEKEYGIREAEVKIQNKTVGVYLPVGKLFTADLDSEWKTYAKVGFLETENPFLIMIFGALATPTDSYWEVLYKIYGLEILKEFKLNWVRKKHVKKEIKSLQDAIAIHPEVQNKLGDIFFTMARVIRSTDEDLDFYVLQITDVNTGHEFVIVNYVEDVKRALLWDISRGEYDRRMLRMTTINATALMHMPVRRFFSDLNENIRSDVQSVYFKNLDESVWKEEFFFGEDPSLTSEVTWEVEDVRSLPYKDQKIFVYSKIKVFPRNAKKLGFESEEREYIFEILFKDQMAHIQKIIPFRFLENTAEDSAIGLDAKSIRDNLENWNAEFVVREWNLDDFLAEQLTRRITNVVFDNERIFNTFAGVNLSVLAHAEPVPHFSLNIDAPLKDEEASHPDSLIYHEDMLYLLELAFKEIAYVLHTYRYDPEVYVRLFYAQDPGEHKSLRADIDLYRNGEASVSNIIQPAAAV